MVLLGELNKDFKLIKLYIYIPGSFAHELATLLVQYLLRREFGFALGRSEFKILSVLTWDSPETTPEITNADVAEITAVLQSLPETLFLPRDTVCLFGRRLKSEEEIWTEWVRVILEKGREAALVKS